jgi:tetratricopeptide (TPR) repeat protein
VGVLTLHGQVGSVKEQAASEDAQALSKAFEAGELAYSKKEYGLAEEQYLLALSLARKSRLPDAVQIQSGVLRGLGDLYGVEQKYAEAEAMFRQRLDLLTATPRSGGDDLGSAFFDLGTLYVGTGRYVESEQPLGEAMRHYKACSDGPGALGVLCLKGLANAETLQGSSYIFQGKLEKAEPLIKHVMGLPDNAVEPSVRYASLQAYAVILKARGRVIESEKIHQRAELYRQQSPEQPAPPK